MSFFFNTFYQHNSKAHTYTHTICLHVDVHSTILVTFLSFSFFYTIGLEKIGKFGGYIYEQQMNFLNNVQYKKKPI